MIPSDISAQVDVALTQGGVDGPILTVEALGGGCIHPAARVQTASGQSAFLKWARSKGPAGFDIEADGLRALASAGGPRVPKVLSVVPGGISTRGWILLEFVAPGPAGPHTTRRLGRGLSQLHRRLHGSEPGWDQDGFIGRLPQPNHARGAHWPEFWRDTRLETQWQMASAHFSPRAQQSWRKLMEGVEPALSGWEADGLSLLHGDLWSGNVLTDQSGDPFLVDPAVYRGHREVDLAMMELFGGFDAAVYEAYERETPLQEGYREYRRDLYQLYPMLVHVNLFGSSYVGGVIDRVQRLLRTLS